MIGKWIVRMIWRVRFVLRKGQLIHHPDVPCRRLHTAGVRLGLGTIFQPSVGVGAIIVHQSRITAFDNGHHLLTGDGLLLEQIGGNFVQHFSVG